MKRSTCAALSRWLTARIVNPWPPNDRLNCSIDGISSLHGPHQVAQKLSSIKLPRLPLKLAMLPPPSLRLKSGARVNAGEARPIDLRSSPVEDPPLFCC